MIRVPDLEKVRLTFTAFDLVPESCGDFVDVYDDPSDGAAQLGENWHLLNPKSIPFLHGEHLCSRFYLPKNINLNYCRSFLWKQGPGSGVV